MELLKNGSNKLLIHIFLDHPGQSGDMDAGGGRGKGKKGRGGPSKTVSTSFKGQLVSLRIMLKEYLNKFIFLYF